MAATANESAWLLPRPGRHWGIRAALLALLCVATIHAALAADGRALVASGAVALERPQAAPVPVAAGTEFERGDLIRTGSDGRVQIRFTDGSIVSLQPGTAFRIDDYRFDATGQRGFFFLVRGALRTITGAIGKRDHDDYRMQTPTATVGVRGTEYVAEQTACDPRCAPGPREGLRVSVTKGRIVIATRGGAVEVGEGESAAANDPDAAPRMIEQGPVLPPISHQRLPDRQAAPTQLASGNGSRTEGAATVTKALTTEGAAAPVAGEPAGATPAAGSAAGRPEAQRGATSASADGAIAPSTSDGSGADAVVAGVRLTATPTRTRSGADALKAGGGADAADPSVAGVGAGMGAGADSTAVDATTARGGTAAASGGSPGASTSGGSPGTSASGGSSGTAASGRSSGTVAAAGVAAGGYVAGETPGVPAGLPPIVLDGSGSDGAPAGETRGDDVAWLPDADASVSPNAQRGPDGVLVGIPSLAIVTPPGSTTDTGAGGSGGAGGADDVDNSGGSGGTGSTGGGSVDTGGTGGGSGGSGGSGDSGGTGDGSGGTGDSGGTGGGSGGTGDSGDSGGGIGDSGGTGGSAPPPLGGSGTVGDQRSLQLRSLPPALGQFDWLQLSRPGTPFRLDALGLESVGIDTNGNCFLYCLSRGAARVSEAGADGYASWGRWSEGAVQPRGLLAFLILPADRVLSANHGVHYLVGVPSATVPTQGEFGYSLIGATNPTIGNGSVAPGTFAGAARVAFSPTEARIGLEGTVSIGGGSYAFATAGGAGNPSRSNLTTNAAAQYGFSGGVAATTTGSGPLACGASGCTVNLRGGLFGPDAARLGLSYQVQSPAAGSTISGVGVFAQQPASQ